MKKFSATDEIWLGCQLVSFEIEVEDFYLNEWFHEFIRAFQNQVFFVAAYGGNEAVKKFFFHFCEEKYYTEDGQPFKDDCFSDYGESGQSIDWDPEDLISCKNAVRQMVRLGIPTHTILDQDFGNLDVEAVLSELGV